MTVALEAREVSISFGGVRAIQAVNMRVAEGERRVIIGPNGAGKTTFFNLMAGQLIPTAGQILLAGEDITRLRPWQRTRRGLARTFQISRIFFSLSVWENVLVACAGSAGLRPGAFTSARSDKAIGRRIDALLDQWTLAEHRTAPVQSLSYGTQRMLEIALAFATEPRVVMLDEPTAGLSAGERTVVTDRLKALSRKITLVMTDHDMEVVFQIGDQITVLDRGNVIADGAPEAIRANRDVHDVYLGND